MARPSILPLPDEQVAILLRELAPVLVAHPVHANTNRPFVREFVRVVHQATGSTYSPATYRKLLQIYAPGRHPNNNMLHEEKQRFDDSLQQQMAANRQVESTAGMELSQLIRQAVESAVPRQIQASISADPYTKVKIDFLETRLAETEHLLTELRATAARLATEMASAHAAREVLQQQLEVSQAQCARQSDQITTLIRESEGHRLFALRSIELSRGETRALQDRISHLEKMLQSEKNNVEVFRRLAYRAGAAIPTHLAKEAAHE